ncbi:NAD(P)-dependent oxidoreductase [Rhodoplanes sp. Z2-YC6860]|uniref:NAD(P)-dependent oxidoreductase n=1 Tax=Rhodoplanes sp. Z2-YC6860 TaxID=674703 RepID=UPI00078EA06E|nr:NAD(P)-dependent oxidoreductase [Rhodoplanes sp. Z2-YC6860]AMN39884.1 2-hydroxy-3-oxopropionate reductase [Rhodoplanes sp. Z2-YC6860]
MEAGQAARVVGFAGLGAIGVPMAERLIQGGEQVVVYNRTGAKASAFHNRAAIAATPAEMADKADIVFVCITSADAYRDVVLGPNGLIRGNRMKTYVHLGTNEVALLEELAAGLGSRGIAALDAPMTGGVPRARDGTLTVMASGSRDTFELAEPVMNHYAKKIVYLSDRVGAAQVMKYVNNVLSASNLALACEAMVLGRRCGLDPAAMLEVLNNGTGQNTATLTKIPAQVLTRKFSHGGTLGLMIKDLDAFSGEARRNGVPVPLAEAVIESFRKAAFEEGEREDLTKIIRPMERAAGITVEGR